MVYHDYYGYMMVDIVDILWIYYGIYGYIMDVCQHADGL